MPIITINDVRVALNEISREEVSDSLIQQKIDDATYIANKGGVSGYPRIRFIRAYAAYKSFIVSYTYSQSKFGNVAVRREWERILDELKDELEDALIEAGLGQKLVIDSTPMFDSRPRDDGKRRELVG